MDQQAFSKPCGGKNLGHRPELCFNCTETITAKSQGLPEVTATRKDWWLFVEKARTGLKVPNFLVYDCLVEYGICPKSIVTKESWELVKLWQVCGGLNAKSPAEYYRLPALWTSICSIIETERANLKAMTNGN